jgi:hypothetical protein
MRTLRKIRAVPPARRRVAVQAVVLLPVCELLLALPAGVGRASGVVDRLGGLPLPGRPTTLPAVDVAVATAATADLLPWTVRCLPRAIVARTLLSRYGHDPTVRVGVDPDGDGSLSAHAWVECGEDVVVGDVDDRDRYAPLPLDRVDRL